MFKSNCLDLLKESMDENNEGPIEQDGYEEDSLVDDINVDRDGDNTENSSAEIQRKENTDHPSKMIINQQTAKRIRIAFYQPN